jgi:formylglycine-generating enzyme required for sulfatase activity
MKSPIKMQEDRSRSIKRKSGRERMLIATAVVLAVANLVAKADTNDPAQATKENPYVNSLGMKFVPVPGTKVLFCTTEVTVDQWKAMGRGYNAPSYPQTGNHPAVNLSGYDAQAYCKWLSETQKAKYRLPTDHEWSCAVGIGHLEDAKATPESKDAKIPDVFPWGKQKEGAVPPKGAGNYTGEECKGQSSGQSSGLSELLGPFYIVGYNDGHEFTAPVGSYTANDLGIFDLGGNVDEWCEDKWNHESKVWVLRGGSWMRHNREILLSSGRSNHFPSWGLDYSIGFRVVLVVDSAR